MSEQNEPTTNGVVETPREKELNAKVKALEDDRIKFLEIVRCKIQKLEKDLEQKTEENDKLTKRNAELEKNFKDLNSLTGAKGKKLEKSEEDDMLTRAKELLFEKTKICKNQELQLEALNNQMGATREMLDITKDMLNLRNIESDHHTSRLESMESRLKCEKERNKLLEKKLALWQMKEQSIRKEFEIQKNIFKELKTSYDGKIDALTKQVEVLKSE